MSYCTEIAAPGRGPFSAMRTIGGRGEGLDPLGVCDEASGVGKKCGRAAGVPEEDTLVATDLPAAHQVDKAGHGLAGVNGIEEDAL